MLDIFMLHENTIVNEIKSLALLLTEGPVYITDN